MSIYLMYVMWYVNNKACSNVLWSCFIHVHHIFELLVPSPSAEFFHLRSDARPSPWCRRKAKTTPELICSAGCGGPVSSGIHIIQFIQYPSISKNNIHQIPADGWYEAHYKSP